MGKKWVRVSLCILALGLVVFMVPGYHEIVARVQQLTGADVLVIDPGHGGIDGGAESSQGVSEKAINLAISMEVKTLAEAAGWQVIMTRDTDKGLYVEGSGAIRSLKTQDLKERRAIIEKTRPALAVSIHLNSFREDTSVRGAQVFYPDQNGPEAVLKKSKALAEILQKKVTASLQDGTSRVALGKKDVYLFKAVTCPICIIECGFLSNPDDAQKLQSPQCQQKIAEAIFNGITQFTGKKPQKRIEIIDSFEKSSE